MGFIKHYSFFFGILLLLITPLQSQNTTTKDENGCICEWSEWMEDKEPGDGADINMKYTKLRSTGYDFCESPKDIECQPTAGGEIPSWAICDRLSGFQCQFLCDPIQVRVLCCYCPPEPIGPKFQIESQNGLSGCLSAQKTPEESTSTVSVEQCTDQDYQNWEWVSKYRIKNTQTEQCLSVTADDITIITENCDVTNDNQNWKYYHKSSVLQYMNKKSYINYRKDNQRLRLHASRGTDSEWLALLDVGTTSLRNLQTPKCPEEGTEVVSPHGVLDCSLGSYVSSVCQFSCEFGYSLSEGAVTKFECTDDGEFVPEIIPPTCEKIVCLPQLSAPQHGNITCTNANNLYSTCTYDCALGYKISTTESSTLSCYETKKWDHDPPTCERITCQPNITNDGLASGAISCTSANFYSSVCKYSCNVGFELIGAANHECQLSGKWNDTKPACQKIQCPPLSPPSNGVMSCDNKQLYDSSCKFNCNVGYTMQGSGSATCGSDKQWTSDVPVCQRQECNALDTPDNGVMTCSDNNFYSSSCEFTCKYGYKLEGEPTLKCTEKGWDKGVPTCIKIVCSRLNTIQSGKVSCTNNENYKSVCTYTCDVGFKITPGMSNALECGDDGWNNPVPACQKMSCPEVSNPANGMLNCVAGHLYNSICFLTCDVGYKTSTSPPIIQCMENEQWSRAVPSCKKIQCRKLSSLRSGVVTCNDGHNFNSTCKFECKNGYNLFGSEKATCRINGWDSEMPNCAKRSCSPPLARPYNGQINCDTTGAPECTFKCNIGYTLIGEEKSVCQADETWSNTDVRTCARIECSTVVRSPANGQVSCSDGKMYGSKCSFSCDVGYFLEGEESITCTDKRTWDGKAATCTRISCPEKIQIVNGISDCSDGNYYNSKCAVTCNGGYKLVGHITSTCQINTTWSAADPICERIMCKPVFTNPSNGKVSCSDNNNYGSLCEFSCVEGFTLEGSKSITCRGNGWSTAKAPACKKIICPEDFNSENVIGFCDRSNEYLSKCSYSCSRGYKLIGSNSRQCTEAGTWSTNKPICQRIECPPLVVPSGNGNFSCSRGYKYESECFGVCQIGYRFELEYRDSVKEDLFYDDENLSSNGIEGSGNLGNDEIIGTSIDIVSCQANGYWNGKWKNVTGNCKRIVCPVLENPDYGEVFCTNENYDGECHIYCNKEYKGQVKCTADGKWEPKERLECEKPAFVPTVPPPTTKRTTTTKTTTRSTTILTTTTKKPTTRKTTTTTPPTTTLSTKLITKPPLSPSLNTTKIPPKGVVGITTNKVKDLVTTKPIPTMPVEPITSPGNDEQMQHTEEVSEGGFPMFVIIIVAVVVLLLIIGAAIFFLWKRKSSSKKPPFTTTSILDTRYANTEFGPLIPNGNNGNGNGTHMKSKYSPIPIDKLEMEYNKRRSDDDKLYREEFHSFQEGPGTKDAGGKAQNKDKNRYTNILPYDHSRVTLPKTDEDSSDYINASFIDGYKHKGKFIAAQGPKLNTIEDFWTMIWSKNVSVIIMVTNLDERNEEKCARYWPMSGREAFGDISVSLVGENHLVDFSIRKFSIQQIQGESTLSMARNLNHYHFTSWPDFGVPKTPSGMLKFIRRIKHDTPPGFGSMVVHCSAGVGRTGTFIAIDAMMDMLQSESKVDVHSFVSNMRHQRPEMVQTEQQYIFIYQAMLEHYLYGDTEVEVNEVSSHIDELMDRLPGNVTGMEHEFKKLTSIRIQKENMRAGNNPANMRKNRVLLILPYDSNRVILPMKRGQENTDYINASYIDGYRQKDAYIATQGPLPHTIEDFWRMVWDVQAASVVMLTELVERGQAKCALYWPNEGTEAYGDLRVQKTGEEDKEDYTQREFVLSSALEGPGVGRQQVVKQFHYHGWPEVGSPSSGYSMITLIEDVQRQQQSSGNHPIVIHCSAGAGRTGAFCALITALEQVKAEGVLDIFQIVKCLRIQRPHMVQNLEQYEFCYRTVQEYIDSMSEYYNFK